MVAISNQRGGPASRKYVAEQGIKMSNSSKTLRVFLVALLLFCFRKMAWRSISQKYIVEEGIDLLKPSQKHGLLWSHSSVFDLE